jgi:LuxR family transcriptional regulator, maltose regulon positive regulatory protein
MSVTLLTTKFFIPPPDPRRVPRAHLRARLDEGLEAAKRLTLISAPAGYGKTTLVCDWIATQSSSKSNFAWLALDPEDNDPSLLMAYLLAAFQKGFAALGADAGALLESPQPVAPQIFMTALINDLAQLQPPVTLVLDDYQFINNPAVHEIIAYLLDHLPSGIHLLLMTRSDPPLPLHRYRARSQMVEIRLADLRFTPIETDTFLFQSTGTHLGKDELTILDERTEGWIAGVQMAALSLRGQSDATAFIRSLSGSNRYIVDYLAEEILNHQSPEVQQFLLDTSLLDRFCAALCDALRERPPGASEQILEYLDRSNLFLIPLDSERHWYRYHHLFADLLRVRLKQFPADYARLLQRRASFWFEMEAYSSEAILSALAAGDTDRAADLIERTTLDQLSRGELNVLLKWVHLLPEELTRRRPWLCIAQAWPLAFSGKLEAAESLLQRVEQTLESADAQRLVYEVRAVRCLLAVSAGRLSAAPEIEQAYQAAAPANSLFSRSVVCWAAGYFYRMSSEFARAIHAFDELLAIGERIDNLFTIAMAATELGVVLRLSGQLNRARDTYHQALAQIHARSAERLGYVGRLESFLASVLIDQNELETARTCLVASFEHNRWWENPNHNVHAIATQIRLAFATGDLESIPPLLDEATAWLSKPAIVPMLRASIQSCRVRLELARGEVESAMQWVETLRPFAETQYFDETREILQFACVRVWMAAGQNERAGQLLTALENSARSAGRGSALIETLVLQTLLCSQKEKALTCLAEALLLGEPEGFMRVFIDEGPSIRQRLIELKTSSRSGTRAYIERLLAAFPQSAPTPQKTSPHGLIEPLTEREMDILRAMATGLSNPEIGARLFISTGTVKAHSAAIYRKLDVSNRTEAVSCAKDLGLL